MPHFETIHPVKHSARNMFALVADIESYPQFVPLCQALVVRSEREKAGRTIQIADMTAGYNAIRETFTCQVVAYESENKITASYIDGPFKYLENVWRFKENADGTCDIHFTIDYEFKSKALALLMGAMFDRAFSRFTAAFEERADALYGEAEGAA